MSNHPFGLRGDPFASPATLSAKDASRLIRRRVRAFSGDGGALFPIDTCDLIHELAHGLPDAMLDLAGRSMRVAAAEDAPHVAPDHVRRAAAADERAAAAHDRPPAAEAPRAPEPAPAHEATATAPAGAYVPAAADHGAGDDVPPLPSGGFALPSQPSENLDRDEAEWVSRFIRPTAPGPGAAVAGAPRVHRDPLPRESLPPVPAPMPTVTPEPVPAPVHAAAPPRRRPRRGRSRRGRSRGRGLIYAFAVVCVVAFVARQGLRGTLEPAATDATRPVATAAPAPGSDGPAPAEATPATARHEPEPESSVGADALATPAVEAAPSTGAAPAPPAPAPPAVTPARPAATEPKPAAPRGAAPPGRYALEVATFIFEDRARLERDRLVAAGLRARLVTTVEYGSRVYRVVVGGYPDPAAAERAADSLLADGVVLQARVIAHPGR